jgi:phytoene/squalene synthetase
MSRSENIYYRLIKVLPKGVRDDVMKLYQFVVLVQGFADAAHIDSQLLRDCIRQWNKAKKTLGRGEMSHGSESDSQVAIRHIAYIVHRYGCDPKMVDTYFQAQTFYSGSPLFTSEDDQLQYMQKTSEIVGCIAAKIIGIKNGNEELVASQSRAFQQALFMRNCGEDNLNGRLYFATDTLIMCGLKNLDEADTRKKPAEFREFIEYQASRYFIWQKEARGLIGKTPLRSRTALRTAIATHKWIVRSINETPTIVFEQKVTPKELRLALTKASRRLF